MCTEKRTSLSADTELPLSDLFGRLPALEGRGIGEQCKLGAQCTAHIAQTHSTTLKRRINLRDSTMCFFEESSTHTTHIAVFCSSRTSYSGLRSYPFLSDGHCSFCVSKAEQVNSEHPRGVTSGMIKIKRRLN